MSNPDVKMVQIERNCNEKHVFQMCPLNQRPAGKLPRCRMKCARLLAANPCKWRSSRWASGTISVFARLFRTGETWAQFGLTSQPRMNGSTQTAWSPSSWGSCDPLDTNSFCPDYSGLWGVLCFKFESRYCCCC